MRRRPSVLLLVEIVAIAAWLALAWVLLMGAGDQGELVPIDVGSLATGPAQEHWFGMYFEDQHVGFSVSRVTPTAEGGILYEGRSSFRVATFGKQQEVVTASAALTDAEGRLQRFDFFMAADDVRLSARGEVHAGEIVMEVQQGGEVSRLAFPVEHPPQVSASLVGVIQRTELVVGKRFDVPYFDPVTLSEGNMEMEVTDVEVLENGEEAYWLTSRFGGIEARSLVTPAGDTLRQEGALGLALVRMSPEAARDVPTSGEPADLISLSAVHLEGAIPHPRTTRLLALKINGVDPARLPDEPPLQDVDGDVVRIDVPLLAELPTLPVADDSDPQWLAATITLPAAHPDMREKALEVVGDAPDRLEAVQRLVAFVDRYVEDVPSLGVPNGLEVLRRGQGDCNEHTALFVSLARAVGMPTRIAAGVVYSDRVTGTGAFYYHAWAEVRLGGPADWVPVDPTFGEVPADATHVKLAEGDLERQVEIMAYMGRLSFDLVEAR